MKKLLWKMYKFFNPYQDATYFDPQTNRFTQEKFAQDNGVVCSGFCEYYNDAKTDIQRQVISYDYLWGCKRVGAVDKLPEAKLCPLVKAYKVRS